MNEGAAVGMILLVVLFFTLGYAAYDTFKTEGLRITALMLILFLVCIYFMADYGIFAMPLKGKGFVTKTGVKGTLVGAPIAVDNDRMKYNVAFGKHYVSKAVKQRVDGVMFWVLDFFRGTVTVPIVDKVTRFRELPPNNSEDPKGCIIYSGSINGVPLENSEEIIIKEMESLRKMVNYQNTIMRTMNRELSTLAENENRDVAKTAQRLKSITRDFGSSQRFPVEMINNAK